MAQVKCPDCGKVGNSDEGFCMFCGYNFDGSEAPATTFAPSYNPVIGARKVDPEPVAAQPEVAEPEETRPVETQSAATSTPFAKSPFAQNTDTQTGFDDNSFEDSISDEPAGSNGSPVIRFDGNSMDYSVPMMSSSSSSGELMFGIGFSRILAIFFALMVLISMALPFVSVTVAIPKSLVKSSDQITRMMNSADQNDLKFSEDSVNYNFSRSISLLTLLRGYNRWVILMMAACIAGIIFAIRGKPAIYLACGLGGAVLAVLNYITYTSSYEIVSKNSYVAQAIKLLEKQGIVLQFSQGAGAIMLLIGAVGMIVAAVIFVRNHEAYDD